MAWDLNLRANLRLWPKPSPNVAALVSFEGQPYDDEAIVMEGAASNPRAVRQTFEVLAQCGLAYRDRTSGDVLRLSPLGRNALSFLGIPEGRRFANEKNLRLVAGPLIRALAGIVECRAIWMLMRACEDKLSNEELNRAIARIATIVDVPETARDVMQARFQGDPSLIGPRSYDDSKYGTPEESDQRKAMNPQFLLAGGGGIFISVIQTEMMRAIEPWAAPLIDQALSGPRSAEHADVEASAVLRRSRAAVLPPDLRAP
jgi:hypothetical protein